MICQIERKKQKIFYDQILALHGLQYRTVTAWLKKTTWKCIKNVFILLWMSLEKLFLYFFHFSKSLDNVLKWIYIYWSWFVAVLIGVIFCNFQYQDFNYTKYSALTKIVFAIFMMLVPILLLNMLIAMMGNTYQMVIAKSEKEWRKQVGTVCV